MGGRIATLSPRAILVAGFTVLVLYAYPGFMSSDSVAQLHEARSREYTNAHPPLMAFIWGLLDAIIAGPFLMLLVQVGLFLAGVYGIARRVLEPRPAALVAVGILLYPPIAAIMAVIWKDSQMAAYLLAGFALLFHTNRRVRIGGLALIGVACAFRHNAFAAAVPLIGLVFEWKPGARWWKRYLISGAAAVVTVVAAFSVNKLLVVHESHMTPAYADIVGILAHQRTRTDEDLRHTLRGTPILVNEHIHRTARRWYDPRNSYHLTRGDERMFDDATTPEHIEALDRAWREMIAADPVAYLAHRLDVFKELLGLGERGLWSPIYFGFVEMPDHPDYVGHDALHSTYQIEIYEELVWLLEETYVFDPWFYALLALVVLVVLSRDRISFALLSSGLLYELSFFPTAGTPDCRYSHWMVTCTCLAITVIFVHRYRRGLAARGDA